MPIFIDSSLTVLDDDQRCSRNIVCYGLFLSLKVFNSLITDFFFFFISNKNNCKTNMKLLLKVDGSCLILSEFGIKGNIPSTSVID